MGSVLRTKFACRCETCHPGTCFRLALCAVLKKKKSVFLIHVSDWHRAKSNLSRADNNMS